MLSPNLNSSTSSSQGPTPSASNARCTVEEELAGNMHSPSVSTNPPVVVKEEEQDWSVPENYLYTGDASLLSSSRCSTSFQLTAQHGAIPHNIKALLYQSSTSLTNTVNFLNLIFQASDLRETSLREDIDWYHSLIRSMLVGERPSLVRNALLSFNADPTTTQPQLVLLASKGLSQDIYLQDLTLAWEKPQSLPHGLNQSWFKLLNSNNPSFSGLSRQVLRNDLSTLDTPKWAHGGTYVTNSSGLQWGEAPFLECMEGRFMPGWLLTLSMPFYGLKPDLSPEFSVSRFLGRGFVLVSTAADVKTDTTAFQESQKTSVRPFVPIFQERMFNSSKVQNSDANLWLCFGETVDDGSRITHGCYPLIPMCVPCWPGCKQCQDGSPCWVDQDWKLRGVLLAVHSFFVALVLISMLRVYQCRRTRVLIIYFKPSTFRCILLRWVRLLGFAIVYGTVTLKMYRVLNVFLSCTAQRLPYMSSTSVLRMLGVMLLTVKWFLCAWSMGVLQNQDRNIPLLITLTTWDGQKFRACDLDRWDYMMAMAELLFLCWSSSLSSAVKAVPSAFHEPRYMGVAVHNELLFSTMFHLLRFIKPSLHPDWTLVLFFIHVHITITVTLGLLFLPKFLHISQLIKEDNASEMCEDEVDLRRSCLHAHNSFTSGCWSDHNLDPDDIQGELKKLYAQLEVHKTKKMEKNNPHLRKKRSSRLTFGRSLIRRITEIPESMSRQSSRRDKDASRAGGTPKGSGSFLATSVSTRVNKRNETAEPPSPPVRGTAMRNSSVKSWINKSSSETESIDKAPIFYKSFSAQNLAVNNNFLQPVSTRVQKSFSFTENHSDCYLLSPNKSLVETAESLKINLKDKFGNADFQDEQTSGLNMANQKHAEEQTIPPTFTSPPSLIYVCPWEFASSLTCSSPPATKTESGLNSDVEPSRPKLSISSSAPGSPYSFPNPMAHYGLSSQSATQTLHPAKSMVDKKGRSKHNSKNELIREKGTFQQARSATLSSAIKSIKRTQTPRRLMTSDESKPCLVKQAAIKVSSERKSISNPSPHIHLWESAYENVTQSQNCGERPQRLTESTKDRGSSTAPRSKEYQWDIPNKTRPQTTIADICPWEVMQQDQIKQITSNKDISLQETLGQASRTNYEPRKGIEQHHRLTEAEMPPGDVEQDPAKVVSEATKPTERVIYVNPLPGAKRQNPVRQETLRTEVCPWETCDTQTNQEMRRVDVHPWKSNARLQKNSDSKCLPRLLTKQLTGAAHVEMRPWDFPEGTSCKWESKLREKPGDDVKKTRATKQPTSTAETCPWDFPESPPTVKDYLRESKETSTKPKQGDTTWLVSKKEDLYPEEAEVTERSEGITITKEADISVLEREHVHAKISLWETIMLESVQPGKSNADSAFTDDSEEQRAENYADIHLQETKQSAQSQNDLEVHMYPWDLEVSEREMKGKRVNRPLTRCDALCPWEMKGGSNALHPHNANIITWEEPIAEDESDAETAAEAFIFPPDL
ncbi:putative G-protein coupled receptor 158 isoform X1 [Silurus asotus]|uniref:G-protein coupled receptor 158 isoform X1 n=1 Tax=Silurus asotus TaxID=30991 RepID=A0AAD5FSM1_SILAS|nr:putative G-protein coupled receptor 158 isoform X1 [Silurus asotus]